MYIPKSSKQYERVQIFFSIDWKKCFDWLWHVTTSLPSCKHLHWSPFRMVSSQKVNIVWNVQYFWIKHQFYTLISCIDHNIGINVQCFSAKYDFYTDISCTHHIIVRNKHQFGYRYPFLIENRMISSQKVNIVRSVQSFWVKCQFYTFIFITHSQVPNQVI